jgi:hypothetical protein
MATPGLYQYDGWTANSIPASASNITTAIGNTTNGETTYSQLPPPILNITTNNFEDSTHAIYYNGQTLSAEFLMQNGMCAPQEDYVWGFSLILLFMFLAVTWFFSWVLYGIWLHSYWRAQPGDKEKAFGSLRAAVTVAMSIQEELGGAMAEMDNDKMKKELRKRKAGVRLRQDGELQMLRLTADSTMSKAYSSRPASSRMSSWHGRSASTSSFT